MNAFVCLPGRAVPCSSPILPSSVNQWPKLGLRILSRHPGIKSWNGRRFKEEHHQSCTRQIVSARAKGSNSRFFSNDGRFPSSGRRPTHSLKDDFEHFEDGNVDGTDDAPPASHNETTDQLFDSTFPKSDDELQPWSAKQPIQNAQQDNKEQSANPSISELQEGNPAGVAGDGRRVDASKLLMSPSLDDYARNRQAGLIPLREPSPYNEYSDIWALAVRDSKAFEMANQYSRVGILMDLNFSDFQPVPGCEARVEACSLEEISAAKARMIHEATGLSVIAETHELIIDPPASGSPVNKSLQQGYRTRKVYEEGDAMIDRVRPVSDENRVTTFLSSVAYFDGETEIVTHGYVNVAMVFSAARYATVAIGAALDQLYMKLTSLLGLKLVPDGSPSSRDAEQDAEKKPLVGAILLRERIMREGELLDNSIIKVSSFLNHKVDTELMEACGEELAERLRRTAPTKVLTVESTGLIPGLPTARKLGVPLVFARKSRPITISDSFQTTYRSATKGTTIELVVSCEYLSAEDRVVIIDDFLAGGSTAEALFKLARMAHAKIVGVGVLIEKITDGGRAFLSGYDVPVESLAKVLPSSDTGRVEVVEEEPWVSPEDLMSEQIEETTAKLRAARQRAAKRAFELQNDDDRNSTPSESTSSSDRNIALPTSFGVDSHEEIVGDEFTDDEFDDTGLGDDFPFSDEDLDDGQLKIVDLDLDGDDDDDDVRL